MDAPDIRIHTPGRVVAGDSVGLYVEIVDDSKNTGGFLVLQHWEDDPSGWVYDDWVETRSDLEKYFKEGNWIVEWLEGATTLRTAWTWTKTSCRTTR